MAIETDFQINELTVLNKRTGKTYELCDLYFYCFFEGMVPEWITEAPLEQRKKLYAQRVLTRD